MENIDTLNMDISSAGQSVTIDGIENFLASRWVEGIGPGYAKKIVDHFGTDSVELLKEQPNKIAHAIPGIGESRVNKASESLKDIRIGNMKIDLNLLLMLFSTGISDTFIQRILYKYRKKVKDIIISDPYSMVEDVWQLSFFTADKIGKYLNIQTDDPRRLRAALVSAVKLAAEMGNLFATEEQAINSASRIVGVSPEKIANEVQSVIDSGRLVRSRGVLYLPVFYKAEKEGAMRLSQLSAQPAESHITENEIPDYSKLGHKYTTRQKDAIRKAIESPVCCITGGPGSGKTTVVKGIIDILAKEDKKVTLCAPTGRAAKRLSHLTGFPATTIHSLLGYRQGEGYNKKKIDTDVLIIDEGSMMEQVLFNHLLEAIPAGTKIIMVGDVDQLPAIGAGDVLRDLIESGQIPVARLNENFRQVHGSLITAGANAINEGRLPETDNERDLIMIPESNTTAIHNKIISLISEELPRERGITSTDILVVTPQQIGKLGARQLNIDLQQKINPDGPSLIRGTSVFRLGDPVMQTANSRDRGVYNGEVGKITNVDPSLQTLEVTFSDGNKSTYARSELSELTLAYATTIHKLQGSEAKNIIIPVTMAHKPMLYRNLLYTGVSRATDLCIIVGEEKALQYAIDNTPAGTRNSNFKYRLTDRKE